MPEPYYEDPLATLYNGDAREILKLLPDESVQMVCTSPPYWGLRSYAGLGGEQLGLERTPELYVDHIVEIFKGVRRVLRKDGTAWLVLGDSYYGAGGANNNSGITGRNIAEGAVKDERDGPRVYSQRQQSHSTLKPKDLSGMPWRVAFGLQADGWWVRSEICWVKPAPYPENVSDRPTRTTETIFLLARSRRYYFDMEPLREPAVSKHRSGNGYKRDWQLSRDGRGSDAAWEPQETRAPRNVWAINSSSTSDGHHATFPEELARRCILAGSREGDTVLDPFAGSGTTLQVAKELHRKATGIELSADYCAIAVKRIRSTTAGMRLETPNAT